MLAMILTFALVCGAICAGLFVLGLCRMAGEADDAADAIQDDMQQRGQWS